MDSRKLVFSDGSSNKFWNIELEDSSHTVNYGRVGTNGQTKTKDFDDEEAARASFDKLVSQKLSKGYVDTDSSAASSTSTSTTSTPKKAATKKKKTADASNKSAASSPPKKASAKKASTKNAPEKSASTVADLSVTSEVGLEPAELLLASFAGHEPLLLEEPGEADVDAQVERLGKLKTERYGWDLKFDSLNLRPLLPKEEAHFWFVAMTLEHNKLADQKTVQLFAKKVAGSEKFDGKLNAKRVAETLSNADGHFAEPLFTTLVGIFDFQSIVKIILSACELSLRSISVSLCRSFNRYVLPYIPKNEIPALRKLVSKSLDLSYEPTGDYEERGYQAEHYLAASLGMHEEIKELLSGQPDGHYALSQSWRAHYECPEILLCGLASAGEIEAEWRRLKVPVKDVRVAKILVACTGLNALDILADAICTISNKEEAAEMMKVLTAVRAPEAAEPILQCRLDSKAPAMARDWLDKNVGNAVTGLLETAGGKSKLADAAIDYLRGIKRAGQVDFIEKQLKKLKKNPEASERITRDVIEFVEKVYEPLSDQTTPKWLSSALAEKPTTKKLKLPSWASADQLPPLIMEDSKGNECRLNDEQLQTVVEALASTDVSERHPLLAALKENVARTSRDTFAWRLFEMWQEDGSPSKQKWAMGAIGHLGDDECVMKLTPMVRIWPGESQHARAVFGLQCLRGVGSNTALMQLSGIAQKLKFKGLKTKAAAFVEEIAKERGMTRAELEDRVIPDCGLDENGKREFSFGERSFSFVLGGDLKPMVRDAAGKVRPNPPKPAAKDDSKIAEASLADWKLIKKQIKEVAILQAGRLEQGMVTGRRWPVADFETLLVKHPLMTHLVQKLIWGAFDSKGKHKSCFRVTEERDFADSQDETIELNPQDQIGIMHPLALGDAEKGRWGEVMSDYELIAPFPQLGRDVYTVEDLDKRAKEIPGFDGLTLSAPTMVFTLEKLGWIRGEPMDGGCFDEHSKQFPSANVTAVINYEGVAAMGYIDPDETLEVNSVLFCEGMREPSGYGWATEKKCLVKDVSPIVISEVMADLHLLQSKVK